MATKKLMPVKKKEEASEAPTTASAPSGAPNLDSDNLIKLNEKVNILNQYMHQVDWKLWMIMNMVRLIGEENGYSFKEIDSAINNSTEE
jgi:hypothetical protein